MGIYVCAKARALSIVSRTGTLMGLMDGAAPFFRRLCKQRYQGNHGEIRDRPFCLSGHKVRLKHSLYGSCKN